MENTDDTINMTAREVVLFHRVRLLQAQNEASTVANAQLAQLNSDFALKIISMQAKIDGLTRRIARYVGFSIIETELAEYESEQQQQIYSRIGEHHQVHPRAGMQPASADVKRCQRCGLPQELTNGDADARVSYSRSGVRTGTAQRSATASNTVEVEGASGAVTLRIL